MSWKHERLIDDILVLQVGLFEIHLLIKLELHCGPHWFFSIVALVCSERPGEQVLWSYHWQRLMLPCLCLGNWLVTVKRIALCEDITLRPNRSRDLKLVQGQGATVLGSGNVSHLCVPGVIMYVWEMYIIVCLSGSRKTRRYYNLQKKKKKKIR